MAQKLVTSWMGRPTLSSVTPSDNDYRRSKFVTESMVDFFVDKSSWKIFLTLTFRYYPSPAKAFDSFTEFAKNMARREFRSHVQLLWGFGHGVRMSHFISAISGYQSVLETEENAGRTDGRDVVSVN